MDEYYKNYDLVAKALEIAVILTKADDTWIRLDSEKNVEIDEPLYSTVRCLITEGLSQASFNMPIIKTRLPTGLSLKIC